MPHIDVKQTYSLELTSDEYRLIALSLAGLIKEEDRMEALALNTRLCTLRMKSLKNQHEVAFEAMRKAQLLEHPNLPPTKSNVPLDELLEDK